MQHYGRAALRATKNLTKRYSDTQVKVRDATSNDPWRPSRTQMNEIAQLTYDQSDFIEIMEMIERRMNDKGKNWRHVYKSLLLLDYCLHQGSENVVTFTLDNIHVIKMFKEFQYIDTDWKDQGANVRHQADDIINLLQDQARLSEKRRAIRNEHELRSINEASRKSLVHDGQDPGERVLQQALELRKEEEKKGKRDIESYNEAALFDGLNQLSSPTQTDNAIQLAFEDRIITHDSGPVDDSDAQIKTFSPGLYNGETITTSNEIISRTIQPGSENVSTTLHDPDEASLLSGVPSRPPSIFVDELDGSSCYISNHKFSSTSLSSTSLPQHQDLKYLLSQWNGHMNMSNDDNSISTIEFSANSKPTSTLSLHVDDYLTPTVERLETDLDLSPNIVESEGTETQLTDQTRCDDGGQLNTSGSLQNHLSGEALSLLTSAEKLPKNLTVGGNYNTAQHSYNTTSEYHENSHNDNSQLNVHNYASDFWTVRVDTSLSGVVETACGVYSDIIYTPLQPVQQVASASRSLRAARQASDELISEPALPISFIARAESKQMTMKRMTINGAFPTKGRIEATSVVKKTIAKVKAAESNDPLAFLEDAANTAAQILSQVEATAIIKGKIDQNVVELALDSHAIVYIAIHTCESAALRESELRKAKENVKVLAEILRNIFEMVLKILTRGFIMKAMTLAKDTSAILDYRYSLLTWLAAFINDPSIAGVDIHCALEKILSGSQVYRRPTAQPSPNPSSETPSTNIPSLANDTSAQEPYCIPPFTEPVVADNGFII